jgi:photosystem II stability/assembly factor-like uncharacterized protein
MSKGHNLRRFLHWSRPVTGADLLKKVLVLVSLGAGIAQAQEWTSLGLSTEGLTGIAIAPSDPRTIYAGSIGRLFKSSNGGASWDTVFRTGATAALAVDPRDPAVLYVAGSLNLQGQIAAILKTTDGGQTWARADSGILAGVLGNIAVDPSRPDTLYASSGDVTNPPGVYRSTDAGLSWTRMVNWNIHALALNPWNPSQVWVTTSSGNTSWTSNTGETWTTVSPVPWPGLTPTCLAFASYGTCILAGSKWYRGVSRIGDALYASTDAGVTWQAHVTGLPDSASVSDIEVVPGPSGDRLFIAAGRVYEADGDLVWKDISGDGIRRITNLEIGGDLLYAMEFGGGLYARSAITSVGPTRQEPWVLSLWQNYPNPFNPSTTIRYGLLERLHVRLSVYSTLGQQVAQLVDEDVEAGDHEVKFDASNLPSGVYFCRLQAGRSVVTMKLCLAR